MVKTGYISFIQEAGGGFDEDGNAVASTKAPTAYFEANLKQVTKEYKVLVHGDYIQAKYSCYISSHVFNKLGIPLDSVKEVLLQDSIQNELGSFRVQSSEFCNLIKQIKFIV